MSMIVLENSFMQTGQEYRAQTNVLSLAWGDDREDTGTIKTSGTS